MTCVQRRTNGLWAVRWRDQTGRQRWQTFRSEGEAARFARAVDGRPESAVSFSKFVEDWRTRQLWVAIAVGMAVFWLLRIPF